MIKINVEGFEKLLLGYPGFGLLSSATALVLACTVLQTILSSPLVYAKSFVRASG